MTATHAHTTDDRTPMDPMRRTALVAGAIYLLTFFASIPALVLKAPVLDHTDFVLGAGSESSVVWAGFLDTVTALACIGTAVALYGVARRVSGTAAIGFVSVPVPRGRRHHGRRHQPPVGRDPAPGRRRHGRRRHRRPAHHREALVAVHDWTFLLGPGLMAGINALLLGTVMYRSRLVPRIIPTMGLIGAPLLIASSIATMFGAWDQVRPWPGSPPPPSPSGSSRSASGWW